MTAPTRTETLDTEFSLIARERVGLYDNYFVANPVYEQIVKRCMLPEKAGSEVDITFEYASNPNVGSIGKTEEVDVAFPDIAMTAHIPYRTVYANLPIAHQDRNAAAATFDGMVGFVDALMDNTRKTFRAKIAELQFLDGTGNNGKDPYGFAHTISTDPTSDTIYGEIARSSNSWARNQYRTSAGSVATYGEEYLLNMDTLCSDGQKHIDFIVTDKTTWQYFAKLQFSYADKAAGNENGIFTLGYRGLKFFDTIIIWDPNCPSGYTYHYNLDTWKIQPLKGEKLIVYPWEKLPRQRVSIQATYSTFNMYCSEPRYNGVISGWSA